MIGVNISFWILAAVCIMAALAVVGLKSIFHAAIALIVCFVSIAGFYVLLSAEFLAVVQILIYVGAISIIIIFAIMMTRELREGNTSNKLVVPAFVVSLCFLVLLMFAFLNTGWNISALEPLESSTSGLANLLFSPDGYIVQVEIAALLLLAAVIGAIVLMRDK